MMFLAKPGVYEACGMFNIRHLILILLTCLGIFIGVKKTKVNKKEDMKKVIRVVTVLVWVLEVLKIVHIFSIGEGGNPNRVVPLYYCSLLLYAGVMSSVGKGLVEKLGNVFLATGTIFGGIAFILFPTTSLPEFPMWHFRSLHSFFFHGTMIYIGIMVNKYKYIDLKVSDLKYYVVMIIAICIPAYIVNSIYGSNLMFISQDFPGMPVSIIYNSMGKLFTPTMILLQAILPFFTIYGILQLLKRCGIMRQYKVENS